MYIPVDYILLLLQQMFHNTPKNTKMLCFPGRKIWFKTSVRMCKYNIYWIHE